MGVFACGEGLRAGWCGWSAGFVAEGGEAEARAAEGRHSGGFWVCFVLLGWHVWVCRVVVCVIQGNVWIMG